MPGPGSLRRLSGSSGDHAVHAGHAQHALTYGLLTTSELAALQDALYAATDAAYRICELAPSDQEWLARYRPLHAELARLFLDAATELIARLDRPSVVPVPRR